MQVVKVTLLCGRGHCPTSIDLLGLTLLENGYLHSLLVINLMHMQKRQIAWMNIETTMVLRGS